MTKSNSIIQSQNELRRFKSAGSKLLIAAAFFANLNADFEVTWMQQALSRNSTTVRSNRTSHQQASSADELMEKYNHQMSEADRQARIPGLAPAPQAQNQNQNLNRAQNLSPFPPRTEPYAVSSGVSRPTRIEDLPPVAQRSTTLYSSSMSALRAEIEASMIPKSDEDCPPVTAAGAAVSASSVAWVADLTRAIAPNAESHPDFRRGLSGAALDAAIMNYSRSEATQNMITYATANSTEGGRSSRGKCFPFVKDAMALSERLRSGRRARGLASMTTLSGHVDDYLGGRSPAREAGSELTSRGFMNLLNTEYSNYMQDPRNAPEGAILVYEDSRTRRGTQRPGHIEIRSYRPGSRFVSDYRDDKPVTEASTGNNYRLIGVYIKPM